MGDYDVSPVTMAMAPKGIAPRDTLHPLECQIYDPVWPAGSLDDGTATAASSTTMTDGSKSWTTNEWRGLWVRCVATGEQRDIGSNTGTVLTLDGMQVWDAASIAALAASGDYEIGPTGPVESLRLRGSTFGMLNQGTGLVEQVPETLGYLVAGSEDTGDPLDEQVYVCTFDGTHSQEVTYSHKASMVTKIRIISSGAGENFDSQVLRRIAYSGLGSALGGNCFWREFISNGNDSLSNPTHGGSEMRPYRDFDAGPPIILGTPLVRLVPSPPIPGCQVAAGGAPGVAKFRGVVRPLDFEADGRQSPEQDKGATPQRVGAYHRHRLVEAYDPHAWTSPYIHSRTQWLYDPARRDHTRYGALGQHQYDSNVLFVSDEDWDEAYWLDPVTGALTRLDATAFATSIGDGWSAWIDGSWHIPYLSGTVLGAAPFTSGYGAVLLRKTSGPNAGLCLGAACKLRSIYDPLTRHTVPSDLGVGINRNAPDGVWNGDPEDEPRFVALTIGTFTYATPEPGWVGFEHLIFTGPWTAAVTTLQGAYAAGLLDAEVDIEKVPPLGLVGTELGNQIPIAVSVPPSESRFRIPTPRIFTATSLIVEDGTGLADANSYASVATMRNYWAALGSPAVVEDAEDEDIAAALRIGTQWLDIQFGDAWAGRKTNDTQALDHPITVFSVRTGRPIASNSLHPRLVGACCEAAFRELQSPGSLIPDSTTSSTSGSTSLSIDGFAIHSAQGVTSTEILRPKIVKMLRTAGLIVGGDFLLR